MNFIIRLPLVPDINFVKVKKCVVKSLSTYCILLNSLLILIKLYRYIDIYYLKLLQYLVGAIVGSFLENILPWPGVPLLLLGVSFGQSFVQSLVQSHVQACRRVNVQTCRRVDVQTCRRSYGRSIAETFVETGVRTGVCTGNCRTFLVY